MAKKQVDDSQDEGVLVSPEMTKVNWPPRSGDVKIKSPIIQIAPKGMKTIHTIGILALIITAVFAVFFLYSQNRKLKEEVRILTPGNTLYQ